MRFPWADCRSVLTGAGSGYGRVAGHLTHTDLYISSGVQEWAPPGYTGVKASCLASGELVVLRRSVRRSEGKDRLVSTMCSTFTFDDTICNAPHESFTYYLHHSPPSDYVTSDVEERRYVGNTISTTRYGVVLVVIRGGISKFEPPTQSYRFDNVARGPPALITLWVSCLSNTSRSRRSP